MHFLLCMLGRDGFFNKAKFTKWCFPEFPMSDLPVKNLFLMKILSDSLIIHVLVQNRSLCLLLLNGKLRHSSITACVGQWHDGKVMVGEIAKWGNSEKFHVVFTGCITFHCRPLFAQFSSNFSRLLFSLSLSTLPTGNNGDKFHLFTNREWQSHSTVFTDRKFLLSINTKLIRTTIRIWENWPIE